jgi:hypothetical protein
METVLIGIAGLCFGVLLAQSLVPRIQMLPMICWLLLAGAGAAVIVQIDPSSMLNAVLFVVLVIASTGLYSAELWKRRGLDKTHSSWQLIWMSAFRPGYLRSTYERAEEEHMVWLTK